MKKTLIISLFVLFGISAGFSQDIDFFLKNQNDKFKFEKINPQMSIDEYQILSRDLRMKEMLYAMIVPGYVHFYAKENTYGYSLLTLRMLALGELGYLAIKGSVRFTNNKPWLNIQKEDVPETDTYFTYVSVAVILGTYFYDWIHGNFMLKKKQENIRYKYNMKMNLGMINTFYGNPAPSLNLQIRF